MQLKPIAHFFSPFDTKFGIPKQSGIVHQLKGRIIFDPTFRHADMLRGMEHFEYLWLIWGFSENTGRGYSALVRPPRLGGNTKVGVFASRSPFRPNAIGLSSVKLDKIDYTAADAPIIHVCGADLMNRTPIYDIKPYLPYVDAHPDAAAGYVDTYEWNALQVHMDDTVYQYLQHCGLSDDMIRQLILALEQDPRPQYHNDPQRRYGISFGGIDIHFRVEGKDLFFLLE